MLKVGLTGGIATGKSHCLSIFGSLGCHTIDADQIARVVVEPGQPAYHEIVQVFGPTVLNADGTIDRAQLGSLIFSDREKRQYLNAIVHPRVMEQIERRLAAYERSNPAGIAVVDAALIVEAGLQSFFDVLVVVYCDEEKQVERLMRRDGLNREQALIRIRAQLSSDEKRRYANFEIDTSGTFQETQQQVERVYQALRAEARARALRQSASHRNFPADTRP